MLSRWERRAEWPLTGLALLFLAAYALPILWPELPAGARAAAGVTTTATWIAFAGDYVLRLFLTKERLRFVRQHPLELAAVALPVLRPLRLLRLVMLLNVLSRHAGASLRGRVVTYTAGATALLSFLAALAVLDAERGAAGANIGSFQDAAWWALTTITTVGYGDRFPVTGAGRAIGAGLMLGGIALLGVVTATLASWLVQKVAAEDDSNDRDMKLLLDELAGEVRALRVALDERPRTHTG